MLRKSTMVHTRLIFNVHWLLSLSLYSLYYKWFQTVELVPQTFHFHNMVMLMFTLANK